MSNTETVREGFKLLKERVHRRSFSPRDWAAVLAAEAVLAGGKQAEAESDELSVDFPYRDILAEGGITTVQAVTKLTAEELDEIPGLGPARIKEIQEAVEVLK